MKDIQQSIYKNFEEILQSRLRQHPQLRFPSETIPDQRIYAYKCLENSFLTLVKEKHISIEARKQILKASLEGIAELHDHNVVHISNRSLSNYYGNESYSLDIKPDNILVNKPQDSAIENVQIIDFEHAAYIPKGRCLKGRLLGNDNWRV